MIPRSTYLFSFNLTPEQVKLHFKNNPPIENQSVLVCNTAYQLPGQVEVCRGIIDNPSSGRQRLIRLSFSFGTSFGANFYRNGKNTFHPKGQMKMIPMHPSVEALFNEKGVDKMILTLDEIEKILDETPWS